VGFGKYNYDQTNQAQEALRNKLTAEGRTPQEIKEQVEDADSFRPYVLATGVGAVPYCNIGVLLGIAGIPAVHDLIRWVKHEEERIPSAYAQVAGYKHAVPVAEGYASGFTAYAIIHYGLKLLKQAPK
jgi:hypothetical protein